MIKIDEKREKEKGEDERREDKGAWAEKRMRGRMKEWGEVSCLWLLFFHLNLDIPSSLSPQKTNLSR
jgi:hypothetical protein